jgi:hypothetical protein
MGFERKFFTAAATLALAACGQQPDKACKPGSTGAERGHSIALAARAEMDSFGGSNQTRFEFQTRECNPEDFAAAVAELERTPLTLNPLHQDVFMVRPAVALVHRVERLHRQYPDSFKN